MERAAGDQATVAALEDLDDEALGNVLPSHPLYSFLACSVLDLDRPFCGDSHTGALARLTLVGLAGAAGGGGGHPALAGATGTFSMAPESDLHGHPSRSRQLPR